MSEQDLCGGFPQKRDVIWLICEQGLPGRCAEMRGQGRKGGSRRGRRPAARWRGLHGAVALKVLRTG